MNRGLHTRLVKRLLVVSLIMAALSGVSMYLMETKRIDDEVVSLALEESKGLMEHTGFLTVRDRSDFEMLRDQTAQHILAEHVIKGNFIIIELYDSSRNLVLAASDPDFDYLKPGIDSSPHFSGSADGVSFRKFQDRALLFFQVFAPLKLANDETIAYFEGVYRVDPAVMRSINRRLWWIVLQVVLVIFATTAVLYPVILALSRDTIRLSDDLMHANMGMLAALGSAVAKRDRDTNAHNFRVTLYAIRLAEAVGLDHTSIQGLVKGAFLHDVGKIGIADAILHKPSGLTREETRAMEAHVQHGVDIVGRYTWLRDALSVVRYHHEKYDGKGYLAGLTGRNIPLTARIFAIVDVFDALTTQRPYKAPASLEEAIGIMHDDRGKAFDPDVFDTFVRLAPDLYREVYLSDENSLQKSLDDYLRKYFNSAVERRLHGVREKINKTGFRA